MHLSFSTKKIVIFSVLFILLLISGIFSYTKEKGYRVELTVDLRRDVGQSFGSLFEVRDNEGRVLAGSGFTDDYNTYVRSDRHQLQFFINSTTKNLHKEGGGNPDIEFGSYAFARGSEIFSFGFSPYSGQLKQYTPENKTWNNKNISLSRDRSSRFDILMTKVGKGGLFFNGKKLVYLPILQKNIIESFTEAFDNNKSITLLEMPQKGIYRSFYYADAHIFFYHHLDQKTKIYAIPWTTESELPLDIYKNGIPMETKYPYETPFAYGQFNSQVLTFTNMGGVHIFKNGQWKTLLEPDHKTSFQVYGTTQYYGDLLLGQYPSGNLYKFDGSKLHHMKNAPPVLNGVSPSAREAQTLSIHGEKLVVGVWPWGEVWAYDKSKGWKFLDRAFKYPALTKEYNHPYELESKAKEIAQNFFGQRVTGIIPHDKYLIVSTSAKGSYTKDKNKYDFLTNEQLNEYGSLTLYKIPGVLSMPIKWKDAPTKFTFDIKKDQFCVKQDGILIGEGRIPNSSFIKTEKNINIIWGDGVKGKLNGNIINHVIEEL